MFDEYESIDHIHISYLFSCKMHDCYWAKKQSKKEKKKYVEKRVGEAAVNSFTAFNLSATDDP